MARGIQLDSREINESFAPKDARVRERVWFCALQMETTSSAMLYRSVSPLPLALPAARVVIRR